jgi:hypothetical protein
MMKWCGGWPTWITRHRCLLDLEVRKKFKQLFSAVNSQERPQSDESAGGLMAYRDIQDYGRSLP